MVSLTSPPEDCAESVASHDTIASSVAIPSESLLPEGITVYRYDEGALTLREYRNVYPRSSLFGCWWQKRFGSASRKNSRIVHVHDYRQAEVGMDQLPDECNEVLWPVLRAFSEFGFAHPKLCRHGDPFNLLQTDSLFAVHATTETVLRIAYTRNLRGFVPIQLQITLFSIFPDGSALVTENSAPQLRAPAGERRQGQDGAEPDWLWKTHTDLLKGIPYPPRSVSGSGDMWERANELQASRLRFNLQRGLYQTRCAAECAADQDAINGNASSEQHEASWSAAAAGGFKAPLVALGWLAAVLAFLAAICFSTMRRDGTATVGRRDPVPASAAAPTQPPKVQPRFVSTSLPKVRDAQ